MPEMEDFVSNAMKGVLMRLPFLLVLAAGIVLIGLRWARHPRTSLLAVLGLVVLLLSSLGTTVAFQLVGMMMNRGTVPFERAEWVYNATSFFFMVLDAIGVGLLVGALLTRPPSVEGPGPP
jgi:hypothetical protein